jgi:hypothetical protein
MSKHNATAALVLSMLSRVWTAAVVQVMAVTTDDEDEAVGFVDVMPLVNQVDGDGNAVPHGTISHCPYFRLQGGSNAVILDPKVGDIGIAVFASRDISSVIANKGQANPGTGGMFRAKDALYLGGILNGEPTQYVQFSDAGITLISPIAITLKAPAVIVKSPEVEVDCTTFTVNASGFVMFNTPIVGTSEAVSVGGILTADQIVQGGKSIDADHTHNLPGGGHTLGVT